MGNYKQGILGPFSGKVGTVVGTFWKGRYVMRGLAPHAANPRTDGQLEQREKFSLIGKLTPVVLPFVDLGFRKQADAARVAPINVFSSVNLMNNAIEGTYPGQSINYTNLQLAEGRMVLVGAPSAQVGAGNTVMINWTDNSGISPETLSSDKVIAILINPTRMGSAFDLSSATRGDESLVLTYPALWAGDTAYLYLAVVNRDGTEASPSLMASMLTLT